MMDAQLHVLRAVGPGGTEAAVHAAGAGGSPRDTCRCGNPCAISPQLKQRSHGSLFISLGVSEDQKMETSR